MNTTLELVRNYLNNQGLTLNFECVELTETGQTVGQALIGEDAVKDHLETLTADNGEEWFGVEDGTLYNEPQSLNPLLRFLGENNDGVPVWLQIA